jgi:hypothetical protein
MSCHADRQPCPQVTRELMPAMRTGILAELPRVCRQKANKRQIVNAVEIEEAISDLAAQPFDPAAFPYAFLEAFGNKPTTIKRLRSGASNKSDLGGVLQTNNIHMRPARRARHANPSRAQGQPGDGQSQGQVHPRHRRRRTWRPRTCQRRDGRLSLSRLPNHFGFFLPLAGITTVKQIRDKRRLTSRRPAVSTGSMSSCSRTTRIGARKSAAMT